jgi:hypothetical protein
MPLMVWAQTRHENPLAFIIFVAFVITMVVFVVLQAKRRTQALAAIAQQMGFLFEGTHWRGPMLSPRFKTTLVQRTRGHFSNALVGLVGSLHVSICDYTYGQGKSRVTVTLACFSQDAELPPFALRPEGFLDKIGDALVHNDIDFDSNPEFSRCYHLHTPNEARTRLLFNPSLLTYFEQIAPEKWRVEASGPTLIIYKQTRQAAQDIPDFFNQTSAIATTVHNSNKVRTEET